MVPDVSTGDRSRGLLSYLFGPGRRNEHTDSHIVAAFAMPGINDPGRVPLDQHHGALSELADYLDQPVKLREQRLGKKVPQHVWHCPVRAAPGDRYLTDEEWAEVARRIVHSTGIAEHGDDAACRWIAVRHAEDHIHIMATSVREDGRRPRNKGDGRRAQAECRRIEAELGLRRLKPGDATAPKTPSGPEVAKAERQGRKNTARVWLREHAYAAAAAARDQDEFFAVLTSLGIKVRPRLGPVTGEVTGYSLATAEDTDAKGELIFYSGSALAPDLSLNRLRERFGLADGKAAGQATALHTSRTDAGASWRQADGELRAAYMLVTGATEGTAVDKADAKVQAQAAAFAELLHNTAVSAPRQLRAEIQAAAIAFNRANRSAIRADHRAADALRQAGRTLLTSSTGRDGDFVAAALTSAVFLLIALVASGTPSVVTHSRRQRPSSPSSTFELPNSTPPDRPSPSSPHVPRVARHRIGSPQPSEPQSPTTRIASSPTRLGPRCPLPSPKPSPPATRRAGPWPPCQSSGSSTPRTDRPKSWSGACGPPRPGKSASELGARQPVVLAAPT
ncbi:relaxase/mobilization nuclease domain-containing protein [Streptomyces sp. 372A]